MKVETHFRPEMIKEPLHLLLNRELRFLDDVNKNVKRSWKEHIRAQKERIKKDSSQSIDYDGMCTVCVGQMKIDGREVFINAKVPYRYIHAWKKHVLALQLNGEKPKIEGLGPFSFASPNGKILIPANEKYPTGVAAYGVMSKKLESDSSKKREDPPLKDISTLVGGFMDQEDFTAVDLPSGGSAVVPFKGRHPRANELLTLQGRLIMDRFYEVVDMQKIHQIVREMDEYDQRGVIYETPARRCLAREGREETGLPYRFDHPIGKVVHQTRDALGRVDVIEQSYIYDLYPKQLETPKQVEDAFCTSDREDELKHLEFILPNQIRAWLNNPKIAHRFSVPPALKDQRKRNQALARFRAGNRTVLPYASQMPSEQPSRPNGARIVQKIIAAAEENKKTPLSPVIRTNSIRELLVQK